MKVESGYKLRYQMRRIILGSYVTDLYYVTKENVHNLPNLRWNFTGTIHIYMFQIIVSSISTNKIYF